MPARRASGQSRAWGRRLFPDLAFEKASGPLGITRPQYTVGQTISALCPSLYCMGAAPTSIGGLHRSLVTLTPGHRDEPDLVAATAALSAESAGGWLCESTPRATLLAGPLRHGHPAMVALFPRRIEDLPAALAYYHVSGANLLRQDPHDASWIVEARECLYRAWRRTDPASPTRWLAAAVAYESHEVHRAPDRNTERSRQKVAIEAALATLGAASLSSLFPGENESGAARSFASKLETILAAPAIDAKHARIEWGDRIAPAAPSVLPLDVLSTRRTFDLSLAQALTYHLVDDEAGPRLTHAQAAEALDMERRQEIGTHLARARERITKTTRKPTSRTLHTLREAERFAAQREIITQGG